MNRRTVLALGWALLLPALLPTFAVAEPAAYKVDPDHSGVVFELSAQ